MYRLIKLLWSDKYYADSLVRYIVKSFATNRKQITKSVIGIIKSKLSDTDTDIFQAIIDYLSTKISLSGVDRPGEIAIEDRASDRANSIVSMLGGRQVSKYLDFGCCTGAITQQIGAALNLTKASIIGVDVQEFVNNNITLYTDGDLTRLARGTFDLITAFVSLHHVEDAAKTLREISALLSPRGIVIIREHDSPPWSPTSPQLLPSFLNIIHSWVGYKDGEDVDPVELYNSIHYRTATEWTKMFGDAGMQLIRLEKFPGNNPQQLYYAIYELR